jgi:hypothetical protein
MPVPDWLPPETWQVGDSMNAATLNRRIRDQMTILLRRPLTVLTNSAAQVIATGTNTVITWDTITQDDDGMGMSGVPVSNIYAQREGTYQFWFNITFASNGTAPNTLQSSIWLNNNSATRRWDYQSKGSSATDHVRCSSGSVFLNAGEYFTAHVFQDTGANMSTKVISGTPSLAVMWLGVS